MTLSSVYRCGIGPETKNKTCCLSTGIGSSRVPGGLSRGLRTGSRADTWVCPVTWSLLGPHISHVYCTISRSSFKQGADKAVELKHYMGRGTDNSSRGSVHGSTSLTVFLGKAPIVLQRPAPWGPIVSITITGSHTVLRFIRAQVIYQISG